jgi:hypothetical protein
MGYTEGNLIEAHLYILKYIQHAHITYAVW